MVASKVQAHAGYTRASSAARVSRATSRSSLLVTTKDRMPEDAVRLREFLRSTAAKPKEESKKQ